MRFPLEIILLLLIVLIIEIVLQSLVISIIHYGQIKLERFYELILLSAIVGVSQWFSISIIPDDALYAFISYNFNLVIQFFILKRYIREHALKYLCIQSTIAMFNTPFNILVTMMVFGKHELFGLVFVISDIALLSLNLYLFKAHNSSFVVKSYRYLLEKSKYIITSIVVGLNYVQFILMAKKNSSCKSELYSSYYYVVDCFNCPG